MADTNQQARTVSGTSSKVDISSLILLAVLLAAGFILNFTLGNALAILLSDAKPGQAFVYGLISAAVIQLTTSIPGLNFFTEGVSSVLMAFLVGKQIGGEKANPFVATFCTTLVSGALFAVCGTLIMGAALPTVVVKVPLVLGTAVFNAVVVAALTPALRKVLKR